jgi:GNAT superfamily N-acetyltransferase
MRPLRPDDEAALTRYFLGLSPATKRVYGPHAFDRETAVRLCRECDNSRVLRMLATVPDPADGERVVGYFILVFGVGADDEARYTALGIHLDSDRDCTLAPSVADDFQNHGLGSRLFAHVRETAVLVGRPRMILMGGVRADNPRAVHFYRKHGFRQVGEFPAGGVNNFDMILDLTC